MRNTPSESDPQASAVAVYGLLKELHPQASCHGVYSVTEKRTFSILALNSPSSPPPGLLQVAGHLGAALAVPLLESINPSQDALSSPSQLTLPKSLDPNPTARQTRQSLSKAQPSDRKSVV